jgi:pyrroloquinoline quinone biosynthesis protein E
MCQVSDWPKWQRAGDMAFGDYKALLDRQIGLIEIKLQGMGEPLLGPCYFDMIRYARGKHLWVRSTTNGSLLHLKEILFVSIKHRR